MKEGWINDDYLILFEGSEVALMTDAYCIKDFIPQYRLVAISGWDNFIIINENDEQFKIPTVPLVQQYIEKHDVSYDSSQLVSDSKFAGKIKWYTKPIVFGGDPNINENMTWIDIHTHQQLVRWWNEKYRDVSGKKP
ncbi:MAG: hypothetical protein WC156_16400 [Pedobacter sp.]